MSVDYLLEMAASSGACGQYVTLTSVIKGILKDYDGSQVLSELLQNADDAGAATVSFILDLRDHPTSTLLSPQLAVFQGPALLCYNDGGFNLSRLHTNESSGHHIVCLIYFCSST